MDIQKYQMLENRVLVTLAAFAPLSFCLPTAVSGTPTPPVPGTCCHRRHALPIPSTDPGAEEGTI